MGYVYKGDEAGLFARVDELMELSRTSLANQTQIDSETD
ncbi:MAG: hypothetical protein ACLU99_02350 [Alphaproteobacteria bacterium]